ncbi:putative ribonuclease H-like domain-containing protein [Tanacetum coccineum]
MLWHTEWLLNKMNWRIEFVCKQCTLDQDGLIDLTGANKAEVALVSLALWLQTQERYLTVPNVGNPKRSPGTCYHRHVDASRSGRISGKGTIKTSCLDFEKVSYVEELKFNLLSVSQICEKIANNVLLHCQAGSKEYFSSGGSLCLVAKATEDEAVLWHRRLGHVNFKNINKLVKGNLVRGLPSKTFKLDHSCLACRKGKQHRASCKKIEERTVREPLELLHMDLFGPVSVESVNRKKYCLVVTDDCSKFSWVFFLAYKDETYDMLHDLIVGLENKLRHKVKTIRKGIKRDLALHRTPQQNGAHGRKNGLSLKAARSYVSRTPFYLFSILGLNASHIRLFVLYRIIWVSLWHVRRRISVGYSTNSKEGKEERIALDKGKECVGQYSSIKYAMTPPQSMQLLLQIDDDIPKDVFSTTNACDAGGRRVAVYNNHGSYHGLGSDYLVGIVYVDDSSLDLQVLIGEGFEDLMQMEFKQICEDYSQQILTLEHQASIHPIEAHKSLGKDEEGEDVDVHLYMSMTGCLMYLTASRPDIMFAVCLCARFQVHSERFSSIMLSKGIFRRITSVRMSISWKKVVLLAMQEIESIVLLSPYSCRICSSLALIGEQFGTNIASALVGLATNQKFNFSLMILTGMLGHISNGTPFLMYPRFVQLFLNKQLEGVDRPQDFIPSVSLPSKVFTFMRKHSPKFSCRITPLTPSMLEVVTALAAEEEHSTSPHSRAASSARDAQGTPTQSAAHSQRTASVQGTASFHGTASIPKSPNDYTPTDASQTSGGDEGLLDIYALNREVKRLKRQTLSQANK